MACEKVICFGVYLTPFTCDRMRVNLLIKDKRIADDTKAAARLNPKCSRKTRKNTTKNDLQYGGRAPS